MPPDDALGPAVEAALGAWSERVRLDREQVDRCREVDDPADFYAPVADRFRQDPFRADDPTLDALRALARPDDTWLDIGAGGGRYALPLALLVREVTAIDPSPGMLDVLRAGMREHGIANIRVEAGRWPEVAGQGRRCDVALMAHVGYDIEAIGPFLDAVEQSAARSCVAVMGEAAMTTAAIRFWGVVHGEPRVALPALRQLLTLLLARGRLPDVRIVARTPATTSTLEELLTMCRRQLWVRPGSPRDRRLADLVTETASQRDGAWALDWSPTAIGVCSWPAVQDIR